MSRADDWDQLWLPLWPLAADDFTDGVYRMARGKALRHRHIEANPEAISNLLVVDIDHPDSALRALSAHGNHPLPTAIVENPRNGHAHAVWATIPFARTEYARRKPVAYAAAITEGLRRAVDGDRGYSGLLTKNPLHTDWETHWLHTSEPRSLGELERALAPAGHMPPPAWRRSKTHRDHISGLGRNCALFEETRKWAYRPGQMRRFWGNPTGLEQAINTESDQLNTTFRTLDGVPDPLPASEVRATSASITRWIVTRSRIWADGPAVYEATLSTIQSARRRKGVETRAAKMDEKAQAVREMVL